MPENGERYATQKDLREAESRIIGAIDGLRDEVVSKDTCEANHRFLDVGKFWAAIGIIGILQLVVLAQAF